MEVLIKASQFILSLSILIIIHELGHYAAARIFKVRVEKFYLFFNPWFSLFKFKRGETEFGLGWLPLGGYVKISGMIDESMDKEQMKLPPQPHEFRSKPSWQRLIIMLGGVTFNLLLAIVIYIFMLSFVGESYLPVQNARYGIVADSLGKKLGLQNGDHIIAINNTKPDDFTDLPKEFIMGQVQTVTVLRNQDSIVLDVPESFFGKLVETRGQRFFSLRYPFIVHSFSETSAAKEAGVLPGDLIVGIGGIETSSFDEFRKTIGQFRNQQTTIWVERDGIRNELAITIPEEGVIGAFAKPVNEIFEFETRNYSFFAAIPAGISKAYTTTVDYVKQLGLLFRPEVSVTENLGGFITIGSIFSPTWDWLHFWTITAFLSVILAVMNILPIPALDGGHVMFLMYEVITRRKPNEKFMEYAQTAGMIFLLGLILFVNFNDVMRLFR
ncbi:MAG TPA: RIP metalloprotease RseP [Bacteroidales bacterium]|nr:RIP metalloprotease RseP [Bacteroidales bacterium]